MSAEGNEPSDENKRAEYLDVSNNMRAYGNMRFAQLTLFIAITAALINLLFGKDPPASARVTVALKIAGLIIAAVFFIFEESSTSYWRYYKDRAKALERDLGFHQYTDKPKRSIPVPATWGARILLFSALAFWLVSLLFPGMLTR
jgi:hypothetical protein